MRRFRLGLLSMAVASCWSHSSPTLSVEEPPAVQQHRVDPRIKEFDGHVDVGESYVATLVRPLSGETWLPASAGSARPAIRVTWTNPDVLAGLADRDPPRRRVVFEVLSRDLEDPGLFNCRVERIEP
jgi:hypothetical protein